MPDTGCLLLSGLSVLAAVGFVLFPHPLAKLSAALNKTLTTLDGQLIRHRYLVAVVLFVVSYLFFRLALIVPDLRS